jgi:hypothetical protein
VSNLVDGAGNDGSNWQWDNYTHSGLHKGLDTQLDKTGFGSHSLSTLGIRYWFGLVWRLGWHIQRFTRATTVDSGSYNRPHIEKELGGSTYRQWPPTE